MMANLAIFNGEEYTVWRDRKRHHGLQPGKSLSYVQLVVMVRNSPNSMIRTYAVDGGNPPDIGELNEYTHMYRLGIENFAQLRKS